VQVETNEKKSHLVRISLLTYFSIIPMFLGFMIDLFFRRLLFTFSDELHLLNEVLHSYFVVYVLSDVIWSFSIVVMVCSIWLSLDSSIILWVILSVFIGTSFEVGQYLHIFNGIYDTTDFIFSLLASVLALIFSRYFIVYKGCK